MAQKRCKVRPPALASVPPAGLNDLCPLALASVMTQKLLEELLGYTTLLKAYSNNTYLLLRWVSTIETERMQGLHNFISTCIYFLIRLCEEWPIALLEVKGGYNLWIQSTNQFWAIWWFCLIQANINFTETSLPPRRPGKKDWIKLNHFDCVTNSVACGITTTGTQSL